MRTEIVDFSVFWHFFNTFRRKATRNRTQPVPAKGTKAAVAFLQGQA
jgi:hypothetical protein